jgi:hypothetical protein
VASTGGGCAVPHNDEVMAQRMGEGMASSGAMLFGRRTYKDFYGYWPQQIDNPFTPYLNQSAKYGVSSTLSEPLPWQNSILLPGDPVAVRSGGGHCLRRSSSTVCAAHPPAGAQGDRLFR